MTEKLKIIDIHTHGIGGYDTRTTVAEHILRIAGIHGEHGVSEIVPTIYPATVKIMRENMAVIKEAIELQKAADSKPSPPGSRPSNIIGINLEGPFLNPIKCGALNAITFIDPTEYNLKKLIEGFEDIIKVITISPELEGAVSLIKTIADMGIIVSMGHSDATYLEAEKGFHAGAKGITHIFNAMRNFHHREPGIVGFGLTNPNIYIEAIADPYHLHAATLELIFKSKNPDRIILVSDTVREAIPSAKGRGITDKHGNLLGGCMTIAESAKRLIEMGFDETAVMQSISENPKRYLKTVTSDEL